MASELEKKRWKRANIKRNDKFLAYFGVVSSTARHRLRSNIIYAFFVNRDGDKCLRCGEPVDFLEYSIDHLESFWESSDPVSYFYDVEKCFMSHLDCNSKHGSEASQTALELRETRKKALQDAFGGGENEHKTRDTVEPNSGGDSEA